LFFSFYLWSISHPGKTGTPKFDLSEDHEACVSSENLSSHQLIIERVIVKTFKHYHIPLDISDTIRDSFRVKLWRMGKSFSNQGTKSRKTQLAKWKEDTWKFTVAEAELNDQILRRKRSLKIFEEETSKRLCLERKLKEFETTIHQQGCVISQQNCCIEETETALYQQRDTIDQQRDTIDQQRDTIDQQRDTIDQQRDTINQQNCIISRSGLQIRPAVRKPLAECSRQQQYNRKKRWLKGFVIPLVSVKMKDMI